MTISQHDLYHALRNTGFIVGVRQWDKASEDDRRAVAELATALAQVGRNAKRQDRHGLGPKDEHAVGNADAPNPEGEI